MDMVALRDTRCYSYTDSEACGMPRQCSAVVDVDELDVGVVSFPPAQTLLESTTFSVRQVQHVL